jgi:hypothetical protein
MKNAALILGALVLVLVVDLPLSAQYPPGGYPGGGYPPGGYPGGNYPPGNCAPGYPCEGGGVSIPGRTKKKKKKDKDAEQLDLQTITGMLRKLDEKYVVVEANDTRVINIKRTADTKFFKNGDPLKPDVLKPGDHLYVEATQDDQSIFIAVNVNLEKEGTEQERARASEPIEIIEPVAQQSHGDDDRPRLHRKESPPDSTNASSTTDKSAPPQSATAGKSTPPPPAAAELPPPAPPEAGLDLDHIPQSTSSRPPADDSDDGPPVLKRGKPAARKASDKSSEKSSDTQQVALNSPPPPASQSAPVPQPAVQPIAAQPAGRAPEAAPERVSLEAGPPVDARIEKARAVAETFTETLPDYVCQEQMARFQSETHVVSWQALDIVSAEVVYEKGRERYRNLAINGKLTKAQRMEDMPGAWSTGEFATVLVDVLSPATAAEFRYRKDSRSGGRSAAVYDFNVDHDHSHWHIQIGSQSVLPAYKGTIWIDKETGRVLRIEMQAYHLPEEFPYDKIEAADDYEFVRIGEGQFLLPVHAENLSCQRGTDICSHNVIDFRNYHKYSGEATIIFGK